MTTKIDPYARPKRTLRKAPTRKRGAAKAPRRTFHSPELIQAGFMAGQGMTGAEIAQVLGGTTGSNVRAQLRHHGVKVQRGLGMGPMLPVRMSKADYKAFSAIADAMDFDPANLAADLLRALAAEPTMVRNLLDVEA